MDFNRVPSHEKELNSRIMYLLEPATIIEKYLTENMLVFNFNAVKMIFPFTNSLQVSLGQQMRSDQSARKQACFSFFLPSHGLSATFSLSPSVPLLCPHLHRRYTLTAAALIKGVKRLFESSYPGIKISVTIFIFFATMRFSFFTC